MSWRMFVFPALVAVIFALFYFLSRSGPRDTIHSSIDKLAGIELQGHSRPSIRIHDSEAYPPTPARADPLTNNKVEATKNQIVPIQPDLRGTVSMQRILAESDPRATAMFRGGLESLDNGDFSNARRAFQEILADYGCDCNQNKIAAPAYWAMGLSYYREGGENGLSLAGTFFQSFLQSYPNCQPQELATAAQLDVAAIYLDRMRLAEKESARERAAQGAVIALKIFLEKWPDSPQAYAASLTLLDVQNYLSRSR